MRYNHKMRIFGLIIFLLSISSCTKVDLEEFAVLTLVTNWNDRSLDIAIPNTYNVRIGDQNFIFKGAENRLPKLGLGMHTAYVYNNAEHIKVDGTKATVGQKNGMLEPMPGWFFTSMVQFENKNNLVKELIVAMRQDVRELEIILNPIGGVRDRIEDIKAHLTGIAGTWDFENNIPVGLSMSIPLSFSKQSDGKWKAKARLLGLTDGKQELIGEVYFTDGRPLSLSLSSDMSQDLKGFNSNKSVMLQLEAELETTNEAGFFAEIRDWTIVDETGIAW